MLSVRLIPHQGLPFRRVEVCNSSEVWANLSIVSIYPKCFICCCCLVAKSCLTLCDPLDLQLTRLLCPWDFPDKRILEWVAIFFSRGSSQPRDWTHLPALAGRFFTTEPPGKPKVSYQFSSVAQLCPTLCDPMDRSMPGLPVHHQLPEFTKTHIHWVGDAMQPSRPLSSPSPPALNLSQHQGLFKWVSSSHQVAKVLEFQLQHQSFQWTLRTDLL